MNRDDLIIKVNNKVTKLDVKRIVKKQGNGAMVLLPVSLIDKEVRVIYKGDNIQGG